MEVFTTIIVGVSVYVLGQTTLKMIIEPMQELKKEIQLVLSDCSYYAGMVTNMPNVKEELIKEASFSFRKRSSELRSKYSIIPFLDFFAWWGIVPKQYNLSEVASNLMGISNTSVKNGSFDNNRANHERLKEIENLLSSKKDI